MDIRELSKKFVRDMLPHGCLEGVDLGSPAYNQLLQEYQEECDLTEEQKNALDQQVTWLVVFGIPKSRGFSCLS